MVLAKFLYKAQKVKETLHYYFSIMLDSFSSLLCSKLCRHNVDNPKEQLSLDYLLNILGNFVLLTLVVSRCRIFGHEETDADNIVYINWLNLTWCELDF